LRRNPLARLLSIADRFDSVSALQRILLEAISSLEPEPDVPLQSPVWNIYEVLHYRYGEKLSQQEIADQLGVCTRHVRRKQHAALEKLAGLLWDKYDLGSKESSPDRKEMSIESNQYGATAITNDLGWLNDTSQETPADLRQTLPTVIDITRKLSARHKVHLEIEAADISTPLALPAVIIRQMLLNLFSVVIPRASGGRVNVSVRQLKWEVEIRILSTNYPSGSKPELDDEASNLNLVHQMADLCGCKLTLSVDAKNFDARLLLPTLEQLPVLAIDDNADTLKLMQRFATGTRYNIKGTSNPDDVLHLVEKFSPKIIVLDVMMPSVDGWELLGRLRQHPLSTQIPIIICTILSQKEMALMLGANGFVRKPITRQTFLDGLDRLVGYIDCN
jgi:CheY-like chemotaxis protein